MVSPSERARYVANLHEIKKKIDELINYPSCSIQAENHQPEIQMRIMMSQSLKDVESYVTMRKTLEQLGIFFEETKVEQTPCLLIQSLKNMHILEKKGFLDTLEQFYLENRRKQSEAIKAAISVNHTAVSSAQPINLKLGLRKVVPPDREKLKKIQEFFAQIVFEGKEAVGIEKEEVRIEYPESYENSYIHISALESTLKKLAIPYQMKSHGLSNFVALIPTHEMNTLMRDQSLLIKFKNEYQKQVRHFTREFQGILALDGFPKYQARHAGIARVLSEMENISNQMPGSSLDNHTFYFALYAEKMEMLDKDSNKNDNEKSAELLNILAELKGLAMEDAVSARKLGEKMLSTFSENKEKATRVRKIPPTPLSSPPLSPSGTPPASPRGMLGGATFQTKGPSLKAFEQVQEELAKKLQKRQDPKTVDETLTRSPKKK